MSDYITVRKVCGLCRYIVRMIIPEEHYRCPFRRCEVLPSTRACEYFRPVGWLEVLEEEKIMV